MELPLFPLNTVLFPGGPLALRIFEPRYLSMISRCMREQHGFGVVLIDEGTEAGRASFASIGTLAEIVDWNRGRDGLLGILAQGTDRFAVSEWHRQPDGLYVGLLERLPPEPAQVLRDRHRRLSRLLAGLLDDREARDADRARLEDATWVGYRLAELLPIPLTTKQSLLELSDANRRLELLESHAESAESQST